MTSSVKRKEYYERLGLEEGASTGMPYPLNKSFSVTSTDADSPFGDSCRTFFHCKRAITVNEQHTC